MKITSYHIPNSPVKLKIALLADIHADNKIHDNEKILPQITAFLMDSTPDVILVAGDLFSQEPAPSSPVLPFLRDLTKIAPVYYTFGNHEMYIRKTKIITDTGAVILNNRYIAYQDILIGGLDSGFRNHGRIPDIEWLKRFAALEQYKILICHHPEYYSRYIKTYDIDLILSGHAHGGQIRIFGQGLFAPGQGILPRYTSGIRDNRLIISRGLANTVRIPRLFNPVEIVMIELMK